MPFSYQFCSGAAHLRRIIALQTVVEILLALIQQVPFLPMKLQEEEVRMLMVMMIMTTPTTNRRRCKFGVLVPFSVLNHALAMVAMSIVMMMMMMMMVMLMVQEELGADATRVSQVPIARKSCRIARSTLISKLIYALSLSVSFTHTLS